MRMNLDHVASGDFVLGRDVQIIENRSPSLQGTRKSARISESIIGMKIGPFISYIKWLGELGSVSCVFIACSVPFVCLIPLGDFFQNATLHISRGI